VKVHVDQVNVLQCHFEEYILQRNQPKEEIESCLPETPTERFWIGHDGERIHGTLIMVSFWRTR